MTPVSLELAANRSRVKHSATEPLRSLLFRVGESSMNIHEGKEREKNQNFRTFTILEDVIHTIFWCADSVIKFSLQECIVMKPALRVQKETVTRVTTALRDK